MDHLGSPHWLETVGSGQATDNDVGSCTAYDYCLYQGIEVPAARAPKPESALLAAKKSKPTAVTLEMRVTDECRITYGARVLW